MSKINKNIDSEETPKAGKFQKIIQDNSKLLLGLIIGVLIMTAGIAFASKGFRTQPNVSSKQQSSDKPAQDTKTEPKQPEASTQNGDNSNNSTSGGTQTPKAVTTAPAPTPTAPPAPTCNLALKDSYTNSYNTQVALENSIHNLWHGEGPVDSSYYARQQGAEDARHDAKLAQLLADYQQKLASIYCN